MVEINGGLKVLNSSFEKLSVMAKSISVFDSQDNGVYVTYADQLPSVAFAAVPKAPFCSYSEIGTWIEGKNS